MDTEVLLTSELSVKDVTSISDNLAGKFLLPSILEVQNSRYRQIVGTCMLDRLKGLVSSGDITLEQYAAYKDLLDRSQEFLAYAVAAECCVKTSGKVSNSGVSRTYDENLQAATFGEVMQMRDYYTLKADAACRILQEWIRSNQAALPELAGCGCSGTSPNLRSSASCQVYLGGARGKKLPGGGGCCC